MKADIAEELASCIPSDASTTCDAVPPCAVASTTTAGKCSILAFNEADIKIARVQTVRRRTEGDTITNGTHRPPQTSGGRASANRQANLELQKREALKDSSLQKMAECLQNLDSCDLATVAGRLLTAHGRPHTTLQHTNERHERPEPPWPVPPRVVTNMTRRSLQTSTASFEIVIDIVDPTTAFNTFVTAVENPSSALMTKHAGISSSSMSYTFTCTLGKYLPLNQVRLIGQIWYTKFSTTR